jgi:hypothetical protein
MHMALATLTFITALASDQSESPCSIQNSPFKGFLERHNAEREKHCLVGYCQ